MSRGIPPPPTKFSPAGMQAKTADTKASRTGALPPPTRFGPAAAQRETRAGASAPGLGGKLPVPSRGGIAPPTTTWPVATAQAKAIVGVPGKAAPKPPPTQFGPNFRQSKGRPDGLPGSSSNSVQCRRNSVRPPGPLLQGKPGLVVPPPGIGAASVIQRHIIYNTITRTFESNGKRPNTHLSLTALTGIITDLKNNGAKNQAEVDFEGAVKSVANTNGLGNVWATPATAAAVVLNYRILSSYDLAVCHKVPYSAFEKLLAAAVKGVFAGTLTVNEESGFKDFLDNTLGGHADWSKLKKGKDTYAVEYYARKLCDAFDENSDNLYIGYKLTNSSVSDSADLHWDSLSGGKATASPKGAGLLDAMEDAEIEIFGQIRTKSYTETDTNNDNWVLYSGVHGTKKQGTGFVEY
jgi:hypothetical protein